MNTEHDISTAEKTKSKIKYPPQYTVTLHNDNYTPMDFVIAILNKIFNKNNEDAHHFMMEIHENGKAIVGIYPKEVAETKQYLTKENSIQNQHPLKCTIEPVDNND